MNKHARVDDAAMARAMGSDFASRLEESAAEPEPQPARVTVYLTEDLVRRGRRYARRKGYTFSVVVKMALHAFLTEAEER